MYDEKGLSCPQIYYDLDMYIFFHNIHIHNAVMMNNVVDAPYTSQRPSLPSLQIYPL
jgi:hypothetical protein